MPSKKINCWEFKKCGREIGGANLSELGVCPAAEDTQFDGMLGGKNGGRCCWFVAGTFCDGKVTGTFAEKLDTCKLCDFYQLVMQEQPSKSLLFSALK